jgi:hypothetical protein
MACIPESDFRMLLIKLLIFSVTCVHCRLVTNAKSYFSIQIILAMF